MPLQACPWEPCRPLRPLLPLGWQASGSRVTLEARVEGRGFLSNHHLEESCWVGRSTHFEP